MNSVDPVTRKIIAGRSIRWNEEMAKTAYDKGLWVNDTLSDTLKQIAETDPTRVVIIDGDIKLDALTLFNKAKQLAEIMASRYVEGSVISFMLPNWHEAAIIYFAATMAGMVAHPILPSLRQHDLRFMLADVQSRMIFIPEQFRNHHYANMLSEVTKQLQEPPEVVVIRGENHDFTHFEKVFSQNINHSLPKLDPDAVRMIMYTSGTTGNPKGVMHSHNSIHALIQQIGKHWLVEPGDKFLVASPISHIGGSIYAFEIPILLGATAVLMEHWNSDQAVQILESEHCTHFAGATPFLVQILDSARRAHTRIPSLKLFVCGGASVPPSLIYQASEYFDNAAVTRVYGSTEVPVLTVGSVNDVDHAANTDGQTGIARIKLASTSGCTVDSGEVVAKGAQMLVGYLHTEDEVNAFDTEGFFRTGDLGRFVDDSYLVIVGRAKDIIIRHGENIAPKEIEDLLVNHPAIDEIAIVGIPNEKTGERACAVIVTRGETSPSLKDISQYLSEKGVAKFKYPEQLEIWGALPKNDAGKVLKHKIRSELMERQKKAG